MSANYAESATVMRYFFQRDLDLRYVALQYARHPGIPRDAHNNEYIVSTRLFLASCDPMELRQIIKLVSDVLSKHSFTSQDIVDYFKVSTCALRRRYLLKAKCIARPLYRFSNPGTDKDRRRL